MSDRLFSVPANHPCLTGHFPGQPIVPGVLLLERLLREAADVLDVSWPLTISHSKFLVAVLPDEPLRMVVERKDDARARLTLFRDETLVLDTVVRW